MATPDEQQGNGKYRVIVGCHKGTLMSRDSTNNAFDTEAECLDHYTRFCENLRGTGYVLWYAKIIDPDGKTIFYKNGTPYR